MEKSLQDGVGQRQILVRPLGMHWWLQADRLCKYRFQRVRHWARQSWSCQFSSVVQPCPTLCDPMDCSTPGLPVHHQLLRSWWELTQTHVHRVSHAMKPSHPLSSPSPPFFSLSQHHGLLKWVTSSHRVVKVLELQHQPFQWIQDWSPLGWTGWISLQSKGLSRVFFHTTVQKHQFFYAQPSLWSNSHMTTGKTIALTIWES